MVDMFTPGMIGGLKLDNRIVRSATWEALADDEGRVTDQLIARMEAPAKGGVGLIILGITAMARAGRGMQGMAGIHDDGQVEGHARLTDAVHRAGGRISIQLAHVGAQATREMLGGLEPEGPSSVLHPAFNVTPRELSTEEVERLVRDFGKAAARAAGAGYDAVQIHGAHGYLVNQFMSPRFNRRRDQYADPARFVMDVYGAVRKNAGSLPVFIKLNLEDYIEGSTTPEIALPIAQKLADSGIDAIEVSAGGPGAGGRGPSRTKIKGPEDEGYFLGLARQVKAVVKCPVIGVGGWRSPEVINRALGSGDVDFVSIARPLIREPGLVRRWKEGDLRPAECISCNRCFGTPGYGEGIQCMVLYRERKKATGSQ